ncbi:hypothetical protein [Lysinibacillus pakistanensis]|uniref:hypothetical protein n=1 Tax=Lysinibacillus pakistanensis TaxID=759811 RepID=UPI003D2B28F9
MKITKLTKGISLKRQLESGNEEQLKVVRQVLADVRAQGDAAIRFYTEKWDGFATEKSTCNTGRNRRRRKCDRSTALC